MQDVIPIHYQELSVYAYFIYQASFKHFWFDSVWRYRPQLNYLAHLVSDYLNIPIAPGQYMGDHRFTDSHRCHIWICFRMQDRKKVMFGLWHCVGTGTPHQVQWQGGNCAGNQGNGIENSRIIECCVFVDGFTRRVLPSKLPHRGIPHFLIGHSIVLWSAFEKRKDTQSV